MHSNIVILIVQSAFCKCKLYFVSFRCDIISCFHYSPDHWSYYVNYLNCHIKCHAADKGSKDAHSPIIKAKNFINHDKSVEEAKKSGRYRAPFLAELELIWKLSKAKLEDVVELG